VKFGIKGFPLFGSTATLRNIFVTDEYSLFKKYIAPMKWPIDQ
jgi:hypothetical protein